MYQFVIRRYDLVHRNGRIKDGKPVELTKETTTDLVEEVNKLAIVYERMLEGCRKSNYLLIGR
jgi:hypothetical protein